MSVLLSGSSSRANCAVHGVIVDEKDAVTWASRLEEEIDAEGRRSRVWRLLWTGINGTSTAGPLVVAPYVRPELRPDLLVGSLVSAVSTGLTFFWPLEIETSARALPPPSLPACQRLAALSVTVASAARDEAERRAWPWHMVNLGVSAALGGLVAFGFGHRTSGIVTGVSGFIAGEAQLFSQPAALEEENLPSHPGQQTFVWTAVPCPRGAAAAATWTF